MTVSMPATLTKDPKLVRKGELLICEMRVAELNGGGPPMFIDVAAFGTQAENCATYLKKGRHIFIDGRLRFEQWKGKDKKTHHDYSIAADRIIFLPGGAGSDRAAAEEPQPEATSAPSGPDPGPVAVAVAVD